MVTGRPSGIYAITPQTPDSEALCRQVELVLQGGVRWVQYRNKNNDATLKLVQAKKLRALCNHFSAALIINDDIELAEEIDADGVHLGREDQSIDAARRKLGSSAVIGASCYGSLARATVAEAAGADYVAFGAFFPSPIKPHARLAPVELLAHARRCVTVPIVAIGGITSANGAALLQAGADALAVISGLFSAANTQAAAREFVQLFERCSSALQAP